MSYVTAEYTSARQAALRLRCDRRSILRLVHRGDLDGQVVGDRLIVTEESVTAMERHLAQAASPTPLATPTMPWVPAAEAARRLRTTSQTIRRWIGGGDLVGGKDRNRVWVAEHSVAALERRS